jgi:hypothetical protein
VGRVWLMGTVYVPLAEVEQARLEGRRQGAQGMRVAFGVTWLLLFLVLLFLTTASGAYPAGLCGTG